MASRTNDRQGNPRRNRARACGDRLQLAATRLASVDPHTRLYALPAWGILVVGSEENCVIARNRWRRQHAHGDVILVRYADDYIAGFEHEDDARRFLADLRDRLAKFCLELAPEKTRLIEFGRYAAERRNARGLGKPETFGFLGFTHICAKTRNGRFSLKRITNSKRMRAKQHQVKDELKRRRHHPIPEQGQWLASVVRGHLAYYAVPGNRDAVAAFRSRVTRDWHEALRRRSQRSRLDWKRMNRIETRWLPPAKIMHPYPEKRFDARTQGRSPVR